MLQDYRHPFVISSFVRQAAMKGRGTLHAAFTGPPRMRACSHRAGSPAFTRSASTCWPSPIPTPGGGWKAYIYIRLSKSPSGHQV